MTQNQKMSVKTGLFPDKREFKSHLSGLKCFLMDKCLKSLP